MKTKQLHVPSHHLHGLTALLNKTSAALQQAITGSHCIIRQGCLVLLTVGILLATCWTASATSYYCDPVTGTSSNPGTSASPWGALDVTLTAKVGILVGGDVIYLRSGYHGVPTLTGSFSGAGVKITPDTGAYPKFKTLSVTTGQNWIVDGLGRLDICPENLAPGTYLKSNIVNLGSGSKNITITNCTIEGAASIAGWTQTDWYNNLGQPNLTKEIGLYTASPNLTFTNNILTNHCFGMSIAQTGSGSTFSGNTLQNFAADGIQTYADNCTFSYNTVMNSYVDDYAHNHDDLFQALSLGLPDWEGKTIGTGTISNVSLIGNIFFQQTDPNQPLSQTINGADGIGCFDGMYANWVIENNIISVYSNTGITMAGCINVHIVNNTVVDCPFVSGTLSWCRPAISTGEHKAMTSGGVNIGPWPVQSTGSLIRNNVAPNAIRCNDTNGGTCDHNIVISGSNNAATYAPYFTNYMGLDFTPVSGTCPLVNTGTTTEATIDIEGRTRTAPYDVGAYEWVASPPVITSPLTASSTSGAVFSYTITATNSPTSFNASGLPNGLSVNTASGVISGTVAKSGTFASTINAINASGTGTATLTITVTPGYMVFEAFNSGTTNNISSIFCSPSSLGLTGTTWAGGLNYNKVISPGLSYTGMNSYGNTLQCTANGPASRAINMAAMPAGYTQVDTDSVTRLGKPGTTLWFRFLIRADVDDAGGTQQAGLELIGASSGGALKMKIGCIGTTGSNYWAVERGTTPVALSNVPIVTGSTVLLVAKVQYVSGTNNDRIDLFVNPPMGATPPATPSATITGVDVSTWDTVSFKGARTFSGDELAIAPDWTSLW